MKRILSLCIILISFLYSFQSVSAQNNLDLTAEIIWQLEEDYMRNYINKDLDSLTNFWDTEFIGWPEWAETPINVADASAVLKKRSHNKIRGFKIRPQNIVVKDNFAVVFYFIDLSLVNENNLKSESRFRIIHTWYYENNQWRIIGGMSTK